MEETVGRGQPLLLEDGSKLARAGSGVAIFVEEIGRRKEQMVRIVTAELGK